jgi:hypothetical protein
LRIIVKYLGMPCYGKMQSVMVVSPADACSADTPTETELINSRRRAKELGVEAREGSFVRDLNQYWFPSKRKGWSWGRWVVHPPKSFDEGANCGFD